MLFSSLEFLFLFLPLSVGLYYLCPRRWRNGVLLLESLVFYAWGEPILTLLMAAVALLNFSFGLWMGKTGRPRAVLFFAVALDLLVLIFFKYTDFLLGLVGFSALGVVLPLGISFYLFQAMSYVVDVYRKETAPEKSVIRFGAYLTFFPQLVAGPIVRYTEMRDALLDRKETVAQVADGIRLFSVGLCKKVLIANTAGELWRDFRVLTESYGSPLTAWTALVCFGLQIYYDFSGYSDMAVGLGRMFGFELPRNFEYPYTAASVREFWHRWHITLSVWFREYVYIPLGGSRCKRSRLLFNLFVTWSLTGLWHGASLNFLLWGLFFFVLLSGERFVWVGFLKRLPSWIQHTYLLFCLAIGWLIFAFDGSEAGLSLKNAITFFGNLFGVGTIEFFNNKIGYEIFRNLIFIILSIVGSTSILKKVLSLIYYKKQRLYCGATTALSLLGILFSIAYLTRDGYNPFLYFRF